MSIIGFNFTKIAAQRGTGKGKLEINNNISIHNVREGTIGADKERKTVAIGFRFDSVYNPKVAHIQLDGEIMLLLPNKQVTEIMNGWKEKKLPTSITTSTLNHILERCNIQALMLARDMNLPSPIPLPKVDQKMVVKNVKAQGQQIKQPAAKTAKKAPKKTKK